MNTELTDVQALKEQYGDEFWAPRESDLQNICPGDCVKIAAGGERFWVIVHTNNNGVITGEVNNHLHNTSLHGLSLGDSVELQYKHVYDYIKAGTKVH